MASNFNIGDIVEKNPRDFPYTVERFVVCKEVDGLSFGLGIITLEARDGNAGVGWGNVPIESDFRKVGIIDLPPEVLTKKFKDLYAGQGRLTFDELERWRELANFDSMTSIEIIF